MNVWGSNCDTSVVSGGTDVGNISTKPRGQAPKQWRNQGSGHATSHARIMIGLGSKAYHAATRDPGKAERLFMHAHTEHYLPRRVGRRRMHSTAVFQEELVS